ncbi:chemotaxis protein CheA [Ramlibacter tataouinensis]|uniref:chemotaxis protein CheA n=1 Tax=Ramlibacter tataouinensis TaxID=94132 RepID=UPI0022F3A2AA|nr:chemotaxis protein CheA [Ramlibacter tataouinensis]WBY00223.1 chemotaxis protein CheA [Ramlibacter tataouinensis]
MNRPNPGADAVPQTFLAESRELLREMEAALLALERSPGDAEAIHALFRAVHTLKGSGGMFGLDPIVTFTHVLEGVLVEVRRGELAIGDALVELLLACSDHVAAMVNCLDDEDRAERLEAIAADSPGLLARLAGFSAAGGPAPGSPDAGAPGERARWHVSVRFAADVLRHGMDPLSFLRYLGTLGEVAGVATLLDALPALADLDPQACYLGLEIQLDTAAGRRALEEAFEYVREGSTLHILGPDPVLQDYADLAGRLPEGADRALACLAACGAASPAHLRSALQQQSSAHPAPATRPAGGLAADAPKPRSGADRPERQAPQRSAGRQYVRVDAVKLDELIELVGELLISSAGVSLGARRSGEADLREAAGQLGRLVEEVRDRSLALRMVPIGETFSRFQRVVHDLGRSLGKDVELAIGGADTELDKSMVEKLGDPLLHLVRNALDHGIEPAPRRLAAGKPARGRIRLDAWHESGHIVIEVADDGAGLDTHKILQRAREAGLVDAAQALSEREIQQLVMEPGFSTADEVTSVSGRGVGMDVVKRNIEALRGTVAIDSIPGAGTRVALRLPLTLAIIEGFLVGVGRGAYVIPLEMVLECLELPAAERQEVCARGYLNLRGEVLPLLRLRDVFGAGGPPGRRENIVVVQHGQRRAGLMVDALLGESQTVIKPLGKLFERLAGISGSTILGSGEVALILDIQALVEQAIGAEAACTGSRAVRIEDRQIP